MGYKAIDDMIDSLNRIDKTRKDIQSIIKKYEKEKTKKNKSKKNK